MTQSLKCRVMQDMAAKGFHPQDLKFDGQIQRFDRNGTKNAWSVCHEGRTKSGRPYAVAVFGDWKDDSKHKFLTGTDFTAKERSEISRHIVKNFEYVEATKREDELKAVEKAKFLWNKAVPANGHPYLEKKGLPQNFGARVLDPGTLNHLVLLMNDAEGTITGIQRIFPDGTKRFVRGQKNKGNFISIPVLHNFLGKQDIYVVEGFATGASVHLATGKPVVCATSANNLSQVCWNLKQYNPQLSITIAGDDDFSTTGNPGKSKALEAAESIGANYVFPMASTKGRSLDFNDLHSIMGIDEVREQLKNEIETEKLVPPAAIIASQFLETNQHNSSKRRLVAWRSEFYQFNDRAYDKLIESDFFNDVVKFIQKHPLAWLRAGKNFGKEVMANIEAIVNAKAARSIPFWLSDPESPIRDVIVVQNGILDLTDCCRLADISVQSHTSDLFQTSSLPFTFDRSAVAPTWSHFLDSAVPDKTTQRSLQEWFGYNLVFDTSFQKFAILLGQGANGKTVVCVVLRTLLGDKNVSGVNLEAFDPKRTFNLAATLGRLANIVEELNVSSKAEEGELKKFVSGGIMTVERKHRDPFEMIPTARLTFATNALPRLVDSSEGIWRRILLYPFKVQILDPAKQDRRLVDSQFWINSGELPGIFNWALEGLFRLRENQKFTESNEMLTGLEEFKTESNPTREFIVETLERDPAGVVGATSLYEDYRAHMTASGYVPLGHGRFGAELRTAFPGIVRPPNAKSQNGLRARVWCGVKFRGGTQPTRTGDAFSPI